MSRLSYFICTDVHYMKTPLILTLTLLLRDLPALQSACRRRDWEFRAGQRHYRWFGRQLGDRPLPAGLKATELWHCTHAIAISGCLYEIGLLRRRGYFQPIWDDGPEGGLDGALGINGGLFWQVYLSEAARWAAFRHNHGFSRHTDYAGTLRLRIAAGSHIAHVRVSREGETTLWIFDGANRTLFRYLADALGRVQSEALALLDPADPEPSRGARELVETIHESAGLERTKLVVGTNCRAESRAPAPPADGGNPGGALSPLRSADDRLPEPGWAGVSLRVQ